MSTLKATNLQHASAASPNIVLDSSGNATMAGTMAMATPFGMRNKIINGAMEIWQRGTSFSGNVYTADRWVMGNNPSSVVQSTDVPQGFRYSIDITGATHLLSQRIELANTLDLAAQPVVLSFWAKSISGTNTASVAIGTPSAADNFAINNVEQTQTITLSSSWVRYTVAFSALSASAVNGVFIYIYRNGSTATDRTRITGVQLEVGSVATPFERRLYTTELQLCQRYFEKGDYFIVSTITPSTNSFNVWGFCQFSTTKRATPTMAGTPAYSNGSGASVTAYSTGFQFSYNAGNVQGQSYGLYSNWTASIEL